MKTMNFFKTSVLLSGILLFSSCSNDDDGGVIVNEEELITHVILSVDGVPYTYEVGAEVAPTIQLSNGSNHAFSVKFEDRSNLDDIEDITEEVIAEADEHFVVYTTTLTNLTMNRASDDTERTDGTKIGLKTHWTVTANQSGKLITLRLVHQPTTDDDEANNNLGSATGGETDVEVSFPVNVVTPV